MSEQKICYTIGHSNHSVDNFLRLLSKHKINKIVDIRSKPYSAYVPQYQKKNLQSLLQHNNIAYIFMGKKLGGFKRIPPKEWQSGIETLISHLCNKNKVSPNGDTAILCGEGDPSKCHRSFLVSPSLIEHNVQVVHILPNGNLLCHSELEELLLNRFYPERFQLSLVDQNSREELLKKAYYRRRKDSTRLL